MTTQRGQDHHDGELELGPGLGHLPVECDLYPVVEVGLRLDHLTLELVANTVLHNSS